MDDEDYRHDFMERFGKCAEDMTDFKAYKTAYHQVIPEMQKAGYTKEQLKKFTIDRRKETGVS